MSIISCSRGPTDEDLIKAVQAAMNSIDVVEQFKFEESMAQEFKYKDTVELSIDNEDFTINQHTNLALDRESGRLDIAMVYLFDDYQDPETGYRINGSMEMNSWGNILTDEGPNDLDVRVDFTFAGGKVESIAFVMNDAILQNKKPLELIVNGEKYEFKDERRLVSLLMKAMPGS